MSGDLKLSRNKLRSYNGVSPVGQSGMMQDSAEGAALFRPTVIYGQALNYFRPQVVRIGMGNAHAGEFPHLERLSIFNID